MPRAPQLSPDGKFYWNGQAWTRMPSDPSPTVFGRALQRVRKAVLPVGGGNPGPVIEQSMVDQGMDPSRPFSPGRPLNPYFGFSADPRQYDFQTGANITARPRHNRVSFQTLRELTAHYDVARMCIARRIDSFRSFEWAILPQDGHSQGIKDEIAEARRLIEKPDGRTPYSSWIAMYLEDLFRYDAATLYRRRDMAGRVMALEIVDGSSIAPMLDENGRPPEPPAPAFIQYVNGVPWDWLTRDDLVYLPYRPQSDSPYGLAPMETILLTANTDLRLQKSLLEQWTEGNVSAGIMEAPEDLSSPAEVEEFQDIWDTAVEGDQAQKHKIRWVPHGANYKPMFDGKFDDPLSNWLLRKTCGAYSVVPQDLGLTMDVNRSSGETQGDIQERISDRPLSMHIDGILTRYLQEDCGLPVRMVTELTAQKEDRLTEAQAWDYYIKNGMASADEGRQKLLGLEIDNERPVPRYVLNPRTGPIPLSSLYAIAGPTDPETAGPTETVPLSDQPFAGVPGLIPDKLPGNPVLHRAPINPDDPNYPANQQVVPGTGVITPPTTVATPAAAAGAAIAPPATAVRKDANKALLAAGLVVRAKDTGRALMLQRALDETDPSSGTWEWPGGHIEGDETAWQAACREWQEETGCPLPDGEQLGSWIAGVYRGFLMEIPSEADLDLNVRAGRVINPDDPDGDCIEVAAWFQPADARDMPALRAECKLTDWDLVCGLLPTSKAETAGITAQTGLVGYDLDDEPEDVRKELRRWRDNARGRVKAGKRPRAFSSSVIPSDRAAAIWSSLEKATTREAVDAAFVRKSLATPPAASSVAAQVLAGLEPELHQLREAKSQLAEAEREIRDMKLLAAVQKAAAPAPIVVEVHPQVRPPAVNVEAPVVTVPQPVSIVNMAAPKTPEVINHNHIEVKPEPKSRKTRVRRHPDGSTTIERED